MKNLITHVFLACTFWRQWYFRAAENRGEWWPKDLFWLQRPRGRLCLESSPSWWFEKFGGWCNQQASRSNYQKFWQRRNAGTDRGCLFYQEARCQTKERYRKPRRYLTITFVEKKKHNKRPEGLEPREKKPQKPKEPEVVLPVDVSRLYMKVGKIVNCEKHPDADALYLGKVG